jgi:hypothetical protein
MLIQVVYLIEKAMKPRSIENVKQWLLSGALPACLGVFVLSFMLYLLLQIIVHPLEFFSNPWFRLKIATVVQLPVSIGFGLYVWYQNRK